jgi:hypothetical protein
VAPRGRRSTARPPAAEAPGPRFADASLASLGLEPDDRVRFRRHDGERWTEAVVLGVERDGSLALRDGKGARRAIPADLVHARAIGPRGGATWEPVADRAGRTEQLPLL